MNTQKFIKLINNQYQIIEVNGDDSSHFIIGKILDKKKQPLSKWTSDTIPVPFQDKCNALLQEGFEFYFPYKAGARRKNISAISVKYVLKILLCDYKSFLKELDKRQMTLLFFNGIEYITYDDLNIILNSLPKKFTLRAKKTKSIFAKRKKQNKQKLSEFNPDQ